MRLIDAEALLETLANKLPQWGFKAIDMHVVETLIKNEPTISQWIPVSERLPKVGYRVIVSIKTSLGEWVAADCIDPYGTEDEPWGKHWSCDVTAWMPMPEPYKESDNDD